MKQRFIALLLAVCIACTMLVVPASASSANTAVQAAVMLGGLTSEQAAGQDAALTRGQLAKLLAAFSPYRESANAQGTAGTLFTDVAGSDPLAPAIRIAVSQGWMSGYTDGSFRPSNPVTLEEACAAALNLLGYDVTTLSGTFPAAQLNKARELGLRDGVNRSQGEGLTVADGAVLLYNALTAPTAEGEVYGSSLGFTVTGGQVDASSILLGNVQGPFVAQAGAQLPFAPAGLDLHPQGRRPDHGGGPLGGRAHQCDGGRHRIHRGFLPGGFGPVQPERRRRRPGGHSAAGHEQRSGPGADRQRGRPGLLRRGPELGPQPDRG